MANPVSLTVNHLSLSDLDKKAEVIREIFKDDRLNFRQRERLAISILNGQFDEKTVAAARSPYSSTTLASIPNRSNGGDNFRQPIPLPSLKNRYESFLQLVSNAAPITQKSAKDITSEIMTMRKTANKTKLGFTWANEYLEASDAAKLHQPQNKSKTKLDTIKTLSTAYQKAKMEAFEKSMAEYRGLKEKVAEVKWRAKETVMSQAAMKRRLIEFRKIIYEHIRETNEGLCGTVMRCLDEERALYFMEKYHGQSIPLDSVVELMVHTLSPTDSRLSSTAPKQTTNTVASSSEVWLGSGLSEEEPSISDKEVAMKVRTAKSLIPTSLISLSQMKGRKKPWCMTTEASISQSVGSGFRVRPSSSPFRSSADDSHSTIASSESVRSPSKADKAVKEALRTEAMSPSPKGTSGIRRPSQTQSPPAPVTAVTFNVHEQSNRITIDMLSLLEKEEMKGDILDKENAEVDITENEFEDEDDDAEAEKVPVPKKVVDTDDFSNKITGQELLGLVMNQNTQMSRMRAVRHWQLTEEGEYDPLAAIDPKHLIVTDQELEVLSHTRGISLEAFPELVMVSEAVLLDMMMREEEQAKDPNQRRYSQYLKDYSLASSIGGGGRGDGSMGLSVLSRVKEIGSIRPPRDPHTVLREALGLPALAARPPPYLEAAATKAGRFKTGSLSMASKDLKHARLGDTPLVAVGVPTNIGQGARKRAGVKSGLPPPFFA